MNGSRFVVSARLAVAGLAAMTGILTLCSVGCSTARRPNTIRAQTLRGNPRLAEGQRVFMQNCNQCHVGGAAGLGPSIIEKPLPGLLVKFQVRNGLGQMPGFSPRRISDSQLDDLVRYMKYLREHPSGPTRT